MSLFPVTQIGTGEQSWTPTLINLSGGTITYAKYSVVDKRVVFRFRYVLGGAGVSGPILISPPVTPHSEMIGADQIRAQIDVLFLDPGNINALGKGWFDSATRIRLRPITADTTYAKMVGDTSATVPFTWGSGDIITVAGIYIAA